MSDALAIDVSIAACLVLIPSLHVVIALGMAVFFSALRVMYQSVWFNKPSAWVFTFLIKIVFKPSTFTYDADAGTVTAAYGNATARAHADANGVDEDGNELDPVVVIEGLKTKFIKDVKSQAENLLNQTDWYITRKAEKNTAIPSAITTWRDGIRTKQAAMETLITNASNTAAIETLYTYVNTADEGDPVVMERPLGEFPELGS